MGDGCVCVLMHMHVYVCARRVRGEKVSPHQLKIITANMYLLHASYMPGMILGALYKVISNPHSYSVRPIL